MREKVRMLRNTKISFTESQLIEIICGSITDVNVRMASFNSNVKSTSELISLFSSYVKPKKRSIEQNDSNNTTGLSKTKRLKQEFRGNNSEERKCYTCGKIGHLKAQCNMNQALSCDTQKINTSEIRVPVKLCTFCKKIGHNETVCWYKARSDVQKTQTNNGEVNFLGQRN